MAGGDQAPAELPPADELARMAERAIERIHTYEPTTSEKSQSTDPLTAMLDEAIDSGKYGKPTDEEQ